MTTHPPLDLSLLPDHSTDSDAPLWLGQLVLAAIEGTAFIILCICYAYYRSKFNVWPSVGVHQPFGLATTNTLLLIASCLPAYLADKAVQEKKRMPVVTWELVLIACGLLFLMLRVWEMKQLNYKWNSHEYGSIVWAMLWLHTFDFAGSVLEDIVLTIFFVLGKIGPKQRLGIRVGTILYYALVALWLPFYCLIYLYPYLLGKGLLQ